MGFYIRKSFSSGPVRFNLSKSGMGVSFGVKGARLGLSPRGMYTHLGRGGLYYRSSYSGTGRAPRSSDTTIRSSYNENIDNKLPADYSDALFDNKQIKYKSLTMELKLKRSWKKDGIYLLIFFISMVIGSYLDSMKQQLLSYLCLFAGIGFLLAIPYRCVGHMIGLFKSNRLYNLMAKKILKPDPPDDRIDIDGLKAIIDSTKVRDKYRDFAFLRFYRDYIKRILSDLKITDIELKDLQTVEGILKIDSHLAKQAKKWIFNKAYLKVIDDKVLTGEEEKDIFHAKDVLQLSDDDVQEETETLGILRNVRTIQDKGLEPVAVNIRLENGEICYHKTKGRIVKEKVVKSYQYDGVRHKVTDLVVEKEGDLYLTSKRIFVVGEGVYNVKLEKIFNVETDIDKNMISLDVESRQKPLQITVPDSYIFSAKLNKLLVY